MSENDERNTGRVADERRAQILEAAAACFVRRGFHQTSMAEICAEAKMSPGSVYRYFRSKEEIIAAQAEMEREQLREMFAVAETKSTVSESLRSMLEASNEWLCDPTATVLTLETMAEAARNQRIRDMVRATDAVTRESFVHLLTRAQHRGEIDPTLDPELTARLLIALYDGMMMRRAIEEYDTQPVYQMFVLLTQRFLGMSQDSVVEQQTATAPVGNPENTS